jgi:uncharacterized protein YjbJ (UPF0337 family)
MNEDILKGKWKQLTGGIKQEWGKLTDDALTEIDGSREKMVGKLQESYGYTREQAERELDAYLEKNR